MFAKPTKYFVWFWRVYNDGDDFENKFAQMRMRKGERGDKGQVAGNGYQPSQQPHRQQLWAGPVPRQAGTWSILRASLVLQAAQIWQQQLKWEWLRQWALRGGWRADGLTHAAVQRTCRRQRRRPSSWPLVVLFYFIFVVVVVDFCYLAAICMAGGGS